MSINKYVGDYRLIEEFDEKGRIHHSHEYIGKPYYFVSGPDEVAAAKKRLLILGTAAFVFYIAAMIPASDMMHSMFVSLPFAFYAVPLFILMTTVWSVPGGTGKPMERRQAERISNRIPQCGMFLMILSAGALIGTAGIILMRAAGGSGIFRTGNVIFSIMAASLMITAVMIFRSRTVFSVYCAGEA